jgi:hypothetical protein
MSGRWTWCRKKPLGGAEVAVVLKTEQQTKKEERERAREREREREKANPT